MKDSLLFRRNSPLGQSVLFASGQLQGTGNTQADYFVQFNNECFVLCDGVGQSPHSRDAAVLAAETAAWAYKHVRQRFFYWKDKKNFLRRIFHTTNITVWQKHREPGFEGGLATTMLVCIIGDRHFWIGSVGGSSAWMYHNKELKKLTTDDTDKTGSLTKVIGVKRYGLVPKIVSGLFLKDQSILLATDGITNVLTPTFIAETMSGIGQTQDSVSEHVHSLLKEAQKHGGTDTMTACIIARG